MRFILLPSVSFSFACVYLLHERLLHKYTVSHIYNTITIIISVLSTCEPVFFFNYVRAYLIFQFSFKYTYKLDPDNEIECLFISWGS